MDFQNQDDPAWPQAILFDLDGTLINSAPDIAWSVNRLLAEADHAPLTLAEVRAMIGNGVRKLVERAFAARGLTLDSKMLDKKTDRMMSLYGDHLCVDTRLLAGADEILRHYHKAGARIGVVTNKPRDFSCAIIARFELGDVVDVVVGGDTCPTRKPAPEMLHFALDAFGIGVSQGVLVGDSPADIDAAKAASMASVAVRGGYTSVPVEHLGADQVIDSLIDLPAAIKVLKPSA